MKIRSTDFFLCHLASRMPGLFKRLGDMETDFLQNRLRHVKLDRPVFITGLARSGTTILLNMFASLEQVGTHKYRDFPFLFIPHWWNLFSERFGRAEAPTERPHKDRIRINRDSPDAFEEPIWSYFFPFVHDPGALHVLTPRQNNPKFDIFFKDHLRKVLLVREKQRYVSKGNYNLTRLRYIAALFPDAVFVIPIRHPVTHVVSLVRQHRLFSDYSQEDERVPVYLRAAGHFEFGPQRVSINVDKETARRVAEAWERQDDHLGYAAIWRSIYAHAAEAAASEIELERRIRFVRYEDFCANPAEVLTELFTFCDLAGQVNELLRSLPEISPPKHDTSLFTPSEINTIWEATREVAERFGYRKDDAGTVSKESGRRPPMVG